MFPESQGEGFHISIVGNVGIGKSTLAKLIYQRLGGKLYLEEPEDYPFVRLFFADPCAWGFANQLQFMITKFAQQAHIYHQNQLAIQEMNAFAIHFIWIPLSLEMGYISQEEMATVGQVYNHLAQAPISTPDLTIILLASLEARLDRIRQRGRDFEAIDPAFAQLLALQDKYLDRFIHEVPGNCMLIDTEAVDFTKPSRTREGLLDDIVQQTPTYNSNEMLSATGESHRNPSH